uniref:Atypical chemokine receptor 1 n=1 Tax=Pelusios castaneus TaxID=367368 RepID=A0A8C8RF59_9SAUR
MGNCATTMSLELNVSDISLEELLQNYSYDSEVNYDGTTPCHSSYCFFFYRAAPSFLAVTCALGLLSNLALMVALAKGQSLWGWAPSRAFLFQLALGTTLFTATLPFFAAGINHNWIFGDGLCKGAYVLWYGSLFAQGLLVATSAWSIMWSKWVPGQHCWCIAVHHWVIAVLLAVPAAMISGTEGDPKLLCVLRSSRRLHPWHLAHIISCLAVFILLPAALGVAKALLTWRRRGWQLRVGVTWMFFLLWVPYGLALLLDSLAQRQLLYTSCHSQEHLDFFLGLSEGLGILHCCFGPLLLLGMALYRRGRAQMHGC